MGVRGSGHSIGMQKVIIWRLIFFFVLCAVMTFALLPTSGTPGFTGQDKLIHLIVFSVLFFLGAKAYPGLISWKWLYLYLGLFSYGVLMELLQGQTSYRSMEAWDLVADSLGLIVGHSALKLFSKYQNF
jgi:hypothetical protein